jgi:serine/threonine protein kinase
MRCVSGGVVEEVESSQRFGEYQLEERIAVGGMAEVWRARAFGLAGFQKTLVIKKILPDLVKDEEFVKLFIDEARIAVLLQHANIVQVFDLGREADTLYMAMEYVHGLDLAKVITRVRDDGPFPLAIALFVMSEVLKALSFAHQVRGEDGEPIRLVHCDISPQNILISHAGEVKITDFGISRAAFQAASLHDTVRGKYAYMSPEQIENKELDGRSDVFSLGIVLWELLTGRRLFKARTRDETLTRVKRAEVPSPRLYRPEVSEELEEIVLRALARKPEQRFATAAEMLDALGLLMVREGHRVTNHDVADFLASMREGTAADRANVESVHETIVVLSAEASLRDPSDEDAGRVRKLIESWTDSLVRAGAQIWERESRSVLAVWMVDGPLEQTMSTAVDVVRSLRASSRHSGFRMAAGLAPGRARVFSDTRRPPRGWELAGPFYLSRWMMNLSAHRGRLLLSRAGVEHIQRHEAGRLGRVSIEDGRYIHLFEIA